MKAAKWYGVRDIRIKEVEEPMIQSGMVKIRVKWCGICGTDLHEYLAGPIFLPTQPHPLTGEEVPVILGHEFSGIVTEIGDGVTRVKVGDKVTVEPIFACGMCKACKAGTYNVCEQLGFLGLAGGGGGFSEFVTVNEEMVHILPDHMTYEQGALVEPTAVAVHAVRESALKAGDSCVVFGAGPIGLLIIQAAVSAGASKIIAVEISEERQKLAINIGAHFVINPIKENVIEAVNELTNGGADVCFEVTGVDVCLNDAIECAKTRGQVLIVSIWEKESSISPNSLVLKERQLKGILGYRNVFPMTIRLIAEGRLPVEEVITEKIVLQNIIEGGFEELIKNKNHIKILVSPT
ncbi:2,3-butanediol dehydrogenase [Metabacillus sp. Hm71]|uniref:2,3-butanediol dehydrogenase n=1 Tax=Metabacillus sp. Hm71 TaxID=3450743 RepID=UPI003F424BDC